MNCLLKIWNRVHWTLGENTNVCCQSSATDTHAMVYWGKCLDSMFDGVASDWLDTGITAGREFLAQKWILRTLDWGSMIIIAITQNNKSHNSESRRRLDKPPPSLPPPLWVTSIWIIWESLAVWSQININRVRLSSKSYPAFSLSVTQQIWSQACRCVSCATHVAAMHMPATAMPQCGCELVNFVISCYNKS